MLKDLIQQDFKEAFKNQEKVRLSVLRMLRADIVKKQQEKRYQLKKEQQELGDEELEIKSALTNEEILDVITSKIKKSKDSISGFEQGGRTELAENEKEEIKVLQKYLPEQFSEEKIRSIVEEVIARVGAESMKDIGRIMTELMPRVKGKADGDVVIKIIREILS